MCEFSIKSSVLIGAVFAIEIESLMKVALKLSGLFS
jgi:hypothetical protein